MITISATTDSVWQRLKQQEITCQEALKLLINEQNIVNLELLDTEVSCRFFRQFNNRQELPPFIPLLLWRNCYYSNRHNG